MVLLDLQKAFDTVNHDRLIAKLEALGADSSTCGWFRSYLSGREQLVVLGGVLSDPSVVECGIPQGSILGPSLFLTYINDMADSCSCELFLYADDSALLMSRHF